MLVDVLSKDNVAIGNKRYTIDLNLNIVPTFGL